MRRHRVLLFTLFIKNTRSRVRAKISVEFVLPYPFIQDQVKLTFLENFDSCEDIITVISTALAFVLQGFFEKNPLETKNPSLKEEIIMTTHLSG